MSTEVRKGRIYVYRSYQIECGGCGDWGTLIQYKQAKRIEEAKTLGYHYSRKRGWLCDKCYRELRNK